MNARKQYGGGFAVLPCLVIAAAALVLPSCNAKENCGSNPGGATCPSSPPPTTLPAQVTRVVSQGSGPLGSRFLMPLVFTTTASGTIGVEVDWTFATNNVDIYLARGADPCTLEAINNRTCGYIATGESSSAKPERLTAPGLAAGTYTLYVGNRGATDESVAYQVTLTSTSASSVSSTTGSVQHSAAKGTFDGKLEPR